MPEPLEFLNDGSLADRNFRRLAQTMTPPVAQARVYNSADVSIPNNAVTAVTFNSERFDNGGLHSTVSNTSRLTAPVTGLYLVGAHFRFAASAAGVREAHLRLNGTTFIDYSGDDDPGAAQPVFFKPMTMYRLTAGDYVEATVYQNSGGTLNVTASGNSSPEFWMFRVAGFVNQGV